MEFKDLLVNGRYGDAAGELYLAKAKELMMIVDPRFENLERFSPETDPRPSEPLPENISALLEPCEFPQLSTDQKAILETAIFFLGEAAFLHNPEALFLMGLVHEYGIIVPQDYDKAWNCYDEGYSFGATVTRHVARMILHGHWLDSKPDPQKAFEIYKEAAEEGGLLEKLALAGCYEHGIGTEKDVNKAKEILSSL